MYPKDIWECSTGAHLPSPLHHLSSLFLLAGGQENLSSCQHCCPSEPEQTHQQRQRGRTLHSKRGLVSSAKEASQQGVCTWCPVICELRSRYLQLFALSGIFELHLFSCEGGLWSEQRAELLSLPWAPQWPHCLCLGSLPQGGGTPHADQVSTGASSLSELWIISRILNVV